jgi:hypothetical protein
MARSLIMSESRELSDDDLADLAGLVRLEQDRRFRLRRHPSLIRQEPWPVLGEGQS